ncbi:MAG: sugar nucleotide-binding protein [Bacteroidota bacterium]
MVILITGGSGFVGWNAVRYFVGRGQDVVATFHTFPHYLHKVAGCRPIPLDFAERDATDQVVARFQPDIIIHTAALARPQEIPSADLLTAINVDATAQLARAAAERDIPFLFLSTDLVFSSNPGLRTESSQTAPSGAGGYADSKLAAESAVRAAGGRWIIIRPTLMFGNGTPRSNSFSQFLDRKWAAGQRAPLFTDQRRSFLYVGDLITAIDRVAIENPVANEIFLCGGEEHLSRADFGLRYADACRIDRAMCDPMRADQLPGYAGGASDIALDCSKLRATGWRPRGIADAFAEMLRERDDNRIAG